MDLPTYAKPVIHVGQVPGLACRVAVVRNIDSSKSLPTPQIHATVFVDNPLAPTVNIVVMPEHWHYPEDCPNV